MAKTSMSGGKSKARAAMAVLGVSALWPVLASAQAAGPQAAGPQAAGSQAAGPPAVREDVAARLAAAPSATISNGQIEVKVLLPDAQKGFYRGTRFDWSGVVGGLTLNHQQFYGPWFGKIAPDVRDFSYEGDDIVAGPNTAMMGPADEFDTGEPQGWAAAAPGGVFVKIGVGSLRRPDEAKYSPFRTYELVDAGKRALKVSRSAITFTHTLASPATGYAYVYTKTLRLPKGAPSLRIVHDLKNTGAKTITTTVYNHNFLTFGVGAAGGALGEGLSVATPFAITTAKPPAADAAEIRGDQIVYLKTLRGRDRVTVTIEGYGAGASDNAGKITQPLSKASVAFRGDQPLTHLQLWSVRSVAALEPFVTLVVAPGQTVSWTYAYDYTAPAAN